MIPPIYYMKFPANYNTVLFCFFMSMSIFLYLVLINTGLTSDILQIWLPKYALSFIVAFPISLMIVPVVRRIVGRAVYELKTC